METGPYLGHEKDLTAEQELMQLGMGTPMPSEHEAATMVMTHTVSKPEAPSLIGSVIQGIKSLLGVEEQSKVAASYSTMAFQSGAVNVVKQVDTRPPLMSLMKDIQARLDRTDAPDDEKEYMVTWLTQQESEVYAIYEEYLKPHTGGAHSAGRQDMYTMYTYLHARYPDKPWTSIARMQEQTENRRKRRALELERVIRKSLTRVDADEQTAIVHWILEHNLNEYGDPRGTSYLGSTPLYNSFTGEAVSLYGYLNEQHPGKPWLHS